MPPHGALALSAGVDKDLFGKTAIAHLAVRQVPAHRFARRCRVARPDRAIDRAVLVLDHFEIGALAFGAMGSDADGLPRDDEATEIFVKPRELRIAGRRGDGAVEGEILVDGTFAAPDRGIDDGEGF